MREAALKKAKRSMAVDLIPVVAEDKGLFFTASNEIGFGFIAEPLWAADSHTASRLNALLNLDWPENSCLQISLWNGPDITATLSEYQDLRPADMREESRVRSSFLRKGTMEPLYDNVIVRNAQVFITYKTKIPNKLTRIPQSFIETTETLRGACIETLRTVGFAVREMGPDGLIRAYKTIFGRTGDADWRYDETTRYNSDELISEQVFDYDTCVELNPSSIFVGEDTVKVLSVKRFPEYAYFGDAISFIGDPMEGGRGIQENALVTASIIFPAVDKTKTIIEGKRSYVQHQAYGPMLRHIPELAELKASFDTLHESFSDGDRPILVYLGLSIFTRGRDKARAAAAVSNARTFWRENGFQLVEDRFITLPAFLNQLPFGVDLDGYKDLYRYKTMATRHVIPMLPLFSDWKGSPTPALTFLSRKGQLMSYSLYDSDSNYNLVIAAQSGSGKSFLTNEFIKSYIRMGGLVWTIDVGRSYEKLCHAMDGQFMVFTKESSVCLNPFTMIKDYEEEADIIVGLLQAMASPTEKMSDYQTSQLRRVVSEVWSEKKNDTTVDDIAAALKSNNDNRVADIGHQLFAFTKKGEYGRFFAGRNNISFSNPFTVLELEELKGKSHLQQVVLLQLIYQIQQEMYLGERDRPKLVLVDEAWDLMTQGDIAKFIETGYRRFRKYGGAAVTITQSINDLYDSPSGRAIAESSAHKLLLGQQAEAIEQIKEQKRLPLADHGYELLKTVKTIPGKYSEIFFMSPYGSGIGRLVVDNFHKLLYSTSAKDIHALNQYRKQGKTIEEAIYSVLEDRGQSAI